MSTRTTITKAEQDRRAEEARQIRHSTEMEGGRSSDAARAAPPRATPATPTKVEAASATRRLLLGVFASCAQFSVIWTRRDARLPDVGVAA